MYTRKKERRRERGMGRGKTVSKAIIKHHQFYTKNKSGSRGGGHTARDGKSPPVSYTIILCPPHTHTHFALCTTAILPTSYDGERKSGSLLNEGPSKTRQKPKARYTHTRKAYHRSSDCVTTVCALHFRLPWATIIIQPQAAFPSTLPLPSSRVG